MNKEQSNPKEEINLNNVKSDNQAHVKPDELSISFCEKIRNVYRNLTVEPYIIGYIFPMILSGLTVQKFNTDKACRIDLNHTEEFCTSLVNGAVGDNETAIIATKNITNFVSNMTSWQSPLQNSVPILMVLFVGAWSDRTGRRKLLMIVPIIGEIICSLGLILATFFFMEWPLWATALIESVPTALSGGTTIALMGVFSYLADITTLDSRTFRIGIFQVVNSISLLLASSLSGVMAKYVSYYGVFIVNIIIYGICLIYTITRIHDVKVVESEGGSTWDAIISFFHPKNVWKTVAILFQSKGRQKWLIILVVLAQSCIGGPIEGEGAIKYLYHKLKDMDPIEMSLINTYSIILGTIGTAVSLTLFTKFFKLHDTIIGMIATVSKSVSSIFYGIVPHKNWFYGGPVLDFFGNSIGFSIRSLATKVVETNDVAKVTAVISFVDAVRPLVYVPLFAQVFRVTQDKYPGTAFIIGGFMIMPAFVIFMILYKLLKKQEKDIVKNPTEKEMHAYDNDLTAL